MCGLNFKTRPHSTTALMRARPRGARIHDYWQQASKRGAAKRSSLLSPPDGETGSAAPITAASEMRRRWCVKKEVVAVRAAP